MWRSVETNIPGRYGWRLAHPRQPTRTVVDGSCTAFVSEAGAREGGDGDRTPKGEVETPDGRTGEVQIRRIDGI